MKRLIALLWLIAAVPALAKPQMTVLLPVAGSMSPVAISDAFRGSASVRAGLPGLPIALIATSLYTSDVALVVLDATQGPLPSNREHILAARQARVPHIYVLFTNVDELYALVGRAEGDELLALEEQEIRAVLEIYEVGGAETPVYHDASTPEHATPSMTGDLQRLAADLSALPADKQNNAALRPTRAAVGEVYLLSDGESNGHSITISGSRSLDLWISGQSKPAEITVEGDAAPGDVVRFSFATDTPVSAAPGERVMFINNDRIVGIGVVVSLR